MVRTHKCYQLQSISNGDGVITIENHAFYNCNIEQLGTILNSVTSLGIGAFARCPFIEFPSNDDINEQKKWIRL